MKFPSLCSVAGSWKNPWRQMCLLSQSFRNRGIIALRGKEKACVVSLSIKTLGSKHKQKWSHHYIKGTTISKLLFSQDGDQLKLLKISIPTFPRYHLKICSPEEVPENGNYSECPIHRILKLAVKWQKPRNSDMIKILMAVRAGGKIWIRIKMEPFLLCLKSYLLLQLLLFLHLSLFHSPCKFYNLR